MQFRIVDSIKEWLNGSRNFNTGIILYEVYGTDDTLKRMFAQGHSILRQKKLEEAMQGLLTTRAQEQVVRIDKTDTYVTVKRDRLPENSTNTADDPYRDKWLPLFKEMNLLRHQLRLMPTTEERGAAAHRILDLEDECRKWWDRRDYEQRTGQKMPDTEPKANTVTDKNQQEYRLRTVRTYITKYGKAVQADPGNIKAIKKLSYYITERDDLETKLGYVRKTDQSAGAGNQPAGAEVGA